MSIRRQAAVGAARILLFEVVQTSHRHGYARISWRVNVISDADIADRGFDTESEAAAFFDQQCRLLAEKLAIKALGLAQ